MDCQICMETFAQDNLHKVGCSSQVDHLICFDCESKWRSKMLVRDGKRVMTCPTCREPELERTKESMQRELNKYYAKSQNQVSIGQLSELVQLAFSRMTIADQAQVLRESQLGQLVGAELAQMPQPRAQAEEIALMANATAQVEARRARRHAEAEQRRTAQVEARAARAAEQRRAEARASLNTQVQALAQASREQALAPPRPVQLYCSSGRDCQTRSQRHTRTKTHLKCMACDEVPCCMKCRFCSTCVPL